MWAGGKTKMLKKYEPHLPESFDGYCEPFLGGAAMFIWAYEKNPDVHYVLNDSNEGIIQIYTAIRDDLGSFLKRLDELQSEYINLPKGETNKALEKEYEKDWARLYGHTPCRRYFYFKVRNEHAFDYEGWSRTKEAATLYFLMKTGFNGVWQINQNTGGRFGTPCGLMNQKDKIYDKENILEWHEALQSCTLLSGDFKDTLEHVGENHYVFLDPPYRGSFTQYGVDFDDELQQSVIDYLNDASEAGAYVLLSNRDVGDGFFEQRKGDNKLVKDLDVTYTAGRRKKTEVRRFISPKLFYYSKNFKAKKAKEILMIGSRSESR